MVPVMRELSYNKRLEAIRTCQPWKKKILMGDFIKTKILNLFDSVDNEQFLEKCNERSEVITRN